MSWEDVVVGFVISKSPLGVCTREIIIGLFHLILC